MQKPLIVLTGPTAVGKTSLSISLAKMVNGEIISADSMQVYKKMDIGSAKIKPAEMQGIPHYLIDVLEPTEEFHVALFQKMVFEVMERIYEKGKIPILVGGTGFYIQAITKQIDFSEESTVSDYRKRLEKQAKTEAGAAQLYESLREVDPASCDVIHANNHKRVIRALEYYHDTGEPISVHNAREAAKPCAYNCAYFVLTNERSILYERINLRVDLMIEDGLVDEVKALKNMGLTQRDVSMQGLGYRQILDYLDGYCSLEEAIERIKLETRHFAKRQLTWFRREPDAIMLDRSVISGGDDGILCRMKEELMNKGIMNRE